jgi:hypothetical protein
MKQDVAAVPAVATAKTLGGFGHSSAPDAELAGREAVAGALAGRAPADGDLVIIFPSASYDLEALHRGAMAEAGPAAVVGCTTVGAFTDEVQLSLGCVAAFLAADEASFGVCHVERDDADIAGSTRQAAETARERAGEEHPHDVLVLLCDGLTPDQREMARGAYEVTSAVIPMVGGAAGDDLLWKATYTFGEGRVLAKGLVAVWINSPRPVAVAVDHGWRPFGKPMLVTRAEGAVIYELDGRPALEAYLSERGAALKEDGRSFGEKCMERPIGLPNARGRYDLRQIHETVPGGGLVLTTGVPEQTVVQVMASDEDSLLEGARRAADAAAESLDEAPRLALVFSCCTRVPLLRERLAEEVDIISSCLGGVPAGGFYTCGEFARVTGSTGIHNSSVALLVM